MTPEEEARQEIDRLLLAAGWQVQDYKNLNLGAALGVAVREFPLESSSADYLLFVDRKAIGAIEAKPEGTILTDVEGQTERYLKGIPESIPHFQDPLPFEFESTGTEIYFADLRESGWRSRRVSAFFRPETLHDWIDHVFVCYSHDDMDFALKLASNLKRRGVPIWLDEWYISAGINWNRIIEKALEESTRLLVILSPSSVASDEVQCEWLPAVDEKKVVIPILYQSCQIPRQLKVIQYIDFTSRGPDDEEAIGEILDALGMAETISIEPLARQEQNQPKSQDQNAPISNISIGPQAKVGKTNVIPYIKIFIGIFFAITIIAGLINYTTNIENNNDEAPSQASFIFTVKDYQTNVPIPNAQITGTDGQNNPISPSPAITNNNGQVTINGISGMWMINISAIGYKPTDFGVRVHPGNPAINNEGDYLVPLNPPAPSVISSASAEKYVKVNYSGQPIDKLPYSKPDIGKTFLLVDITIANHGYDDVSTNPGYFHIEINNVKYDYASSSFELKYIGKNTLETTDLADGGQISGYLIFQIPANENKYQLIYDYDGLYDVRYD